MIYEFIITTDEVANFSRIIEINSDATFLEFNNAILDSVKYSKDQITSFFTCGDHWVMEQEITLMDIDADPEKDSYLMESTFLDEFVKEKGDKLFFIFDQIFERGFYIKLKDIKNGELTQPVCTQKKGKAPKQESSEDDITKHLEAPLSEFTIVDGEMDNSFYGDSEFDSDEIDIDSYSNIDSIDCY